MKRYILLASVFVLLCSSCRYIENHRFIIQNNSDKEIIIIWARFSIAETPMCIKPQANSPAYRQFIRDSMIRPHSNKNFERNGFAERMMRNPNEVLYVGIFYRVDVDTMSCDEFYEKFPIRKEWRVTLADMEANDWTLIYTPKE